MQPQTWAPILPRVLCSRAYSAGVSPHSATTLAKLATCNTRKNEDAVLRQANEGQPALHTRWPMRSAADTTRSARNLRTAVMLFGQLRWPLGRRSLITHNEVRPLAGKDRCTGAPQPNGSAMALRARRRPNHRPRAYNTQLLLIHVFAETPCVDAAAGAHGRRKAHHFAKKPWRPNRAPHSYYDSPSPGGWAPPERPDRLCPRPAPSAGQARPEPAPEPIGSQTRAPPPQLPQAFCEAFTPPAMRLHTGDTPYFTLDLCDQRPLRNQWAPATRRRFMQPPSQRCCF